MQGVNHRINTKVKRRFLPPAGFWWYGSKVPKFRKPFQRNWLKINDEKVDRHLILQAAYIDRYGDVCARLAAGDKSRFSTYRHGNGEYLYASWIATKQKMKIVASNNTPTHPDEEVFHKWPVDIRHYQPCYQMSDASVLKLAERLRRNESLTIFLSSPFNGAQEELSLIHI